VEFLKIQKSFLTVSLAYNTSFKTLGKDLEHFIDIPKSWHAFY